MAKTKDTQQTAEFSNLLKELNKNYGSGTIIAGADIEEDLDIVDTGSITLNIATSIGGTPVGKLIEMYGPESSGKSTIALHIMERFQKAFPERKVVLCDAEQSFDRKYATSLGVDVEKITYVQPLCGEDGYNIVEKLIDSNEVSLVVIDSHTAMMPRAVVDGEVGQATIGLQARINSIALGKIHPKLKKNQCTVVAISQTRTNIGGYGDVNIATGGHAYKFYSDMRFKVSKQVEKADSQNRTVVEVIKNKCGVPYGKATFNIEWGIGIDRVQEVIDLAVDKGLIVKGGAWFEVSGHKVQGNKAVKEILASNPEILEKLEKQILP